MKSFSQFTEEKKKTLVTAFGRFNPPTIGHQKLIDKVAKVAGKNDYQIYPSQSQDAKKNPLSYNDKVKFMRKMFPKHARNIYMDKNVKTALHIADRAYKEGYTEFVYVAGSDRVNEFKVLLNKYNGKERKDGFYNFKDGIQVISAGERDPDAEGVSGMSASKMRAAAADNNLELFSKGLPKNFGEVQELLNAVRKGMGLKETFVFRKHIALPKVSDIREQYTEGNIFNVGDIVTKGNAELVVTERRPNFVVCEDSTGEESKCWLEEIQPKKEMEEGVYDPAIFKAVFLAGGPGSGKSFTVGKTALPALGMKVVNSDDKFEAALKKANLEMTPEVIYSPIGQSIRKGAKELTAKQMKLFLDGRLGLVIDGTGKDYDKIKKQADKLKELGYEVAMIFVNTDVETALNRNRARARSLPDKQVSQMWGDVQKNIGKFQSYFKNNFTIIDNSEDADIEQGTLVGYKKMKQFVDAEPKTQIAKAWIKKQLGEALDPKADVSTWIDDFVKSDAPQFKGKDKKKRIDMALAAYYSARREAGLEEATVSNNYGATLTPEKFVSLYGKDLPQTNNNLTMRAKIQSFGFNRVPREFADKVIAIVSKSQKESTGLEEEKEDDDLQGPDRYYAKDAEGDEMAKSTKKSRSSHFKKQTKKATDDPSAYKPAPGDASAKTKPSKYTKKYQQLYGKKK